MDGARLFQRLATALASLAAVGDILAATVIFDFESDEELSAAPQRSDAACWIGVTNAFATSGDHALAFVCAPWRKGLDQWPSFTMTPPVTDWSGYDRLAVDVVNVGSGGDLLGIILAGPKGRIQNGVQTYLQTPANAHLQWVVQVPNSSINTNVTRVHFFMERPENSSVMIDRITLLKKGEAPLEPSSPRLGRDLMPILTEERDALRHAARDAETARLHMLDYMRFRERCLDGGLRSNDMLLGVATSMEKVMPRGRFNVEPLPKDGLAVRLAGNEFESVQLLVAPSGADLTGVRVVPEGDLTSSDAVFAASNVECAVTGYVRTDNPPPYRVGFTTPSDEEPGYARQTKRPDLGWWPDPILGFMKETDITGQDVQSFWIRVRCPESQRPGLYKGSLVVSAQGVAPMRVPFAVRVNGFALPRTSMLPLAITFNPNPNEQFESAANIAAARTLWKDPDSPVMAWRRHQEQWTSFLADYLIPFDGLYHAGEIWRLKRLEQLRDEGRTGHFNIGYWMPPRSTNEADVAAWRERTIPRMVKFYEGAKALGIEKYAYVYGCDELGSWAHPAMAAAITELKKALPDVPVFTTAGDRKLGVGSLLSEVDWFCRQTLWYGEEDIRAQSRAAGHKVWWYVCNFPQAPYANMFVESQAIEGRLLMGAQTVKFRPDGFLYYQTAMWNSKKCIRSGPFTDWEARSWTTFHGDGSWVCAGPDGTPLPTIRLENFRDGLEDYAYAKILEEKLRVVTSGQSLVASEGGVAAAQLSNNPTNQLSNRASWAQRAHSALAVPREVMDSMTNFTDTPAVLYRWRDEMADLIEESGH